MKKFFERITSKRFFWLLLLILIALPTFWRLLVPGYFSMHDDLQIGRLYQMDLCFADRQLPCRWVPDMGYGYGYPLFNYYPPFPYYLAEVFHLLGLSYINSIKTLFILGFLFSGFFAYLLGKELWGKYGGLVTAAFYLYAPYHAVDVYVRGALNEFWGLVFFPAVFWAVYKIIKEQKNIFVFYLALFLSLLLLSHNLMAFFLLPFLAAWALFLIWFLKKKIKIIWPLIWGGLWGLCLSAFFTLPVLLERNLVHVETMFIGYFNYLAHFATVKQLFFSLFWGFGASLWGPDDGMPFPVGQLHWGFGLLALLVFAWLWLKQKRKELALVLTFFVFFLGSAFLTHQRSIFIWRFFPLLASMQFPWRFLALASFFVSVLAGSFFLLLKNQKKSFYLALVMILAVLFFNLSFFKPERILKITDEEKLFSAKGWNKLQTDAIFDYLPIVSPQPPGQPAPEKPWLVEGQGEVVEFQKGTDWQKFKLQVSSEKAMVRLPLYDFPQWQVKANKKIVETNHENELGLITFTLPQGDYQIEASLKNTPLRNMANVISFITWAGTLFWLTKKRKT
ncbi:hypothetical protein FJZ41_02920 [Candidatus Shapirobacteria bacterium]|nr:hypothetical protein [Candidatus Shapirobacteria bacterium]